MTNTTAAELIARSDRVGSDPKVTNYARGNASAKGTETDPVTGHAVELLWVKGSGGDLGTGPVDAKHVDHLHRDAGIAFATSADGEALTAQAFGGRVAWLPWRHPGFQLGLDIAAIRAANPEVIDTGQKIVASSRCHSRSPPTCAARGHRLALHWQRN